MRRLLELFTAFDWITPSIGFIQDFINDPTLFQTNSWTFFISYEQALQMGWNPNNVEAMLRQHGVKTWGGQLTNGEFFFSVKLDQAQWSEYLLTRNGIPVKDMSLGAPKPKDKQKSGRKNSNDPMGFLDDLLNKL